ncbi:HAMP domain-containing sensor histidine kinase [Sphingomonas xinjiangensis]|uniref:histidine kinase n=1 Tax=Sphingomonas xinjiangensis TaxID=643568 RepID=A0A840YTP7_9SPHN|nr:signal transduction histidine kinase [Sphingomonas xinjiangensis]
MSIGGFGVAVAMLSVTTTASIVVLAPPPPTLRMSAAEAIGALRHPVPGFDRDLVAEPPSGARVSAMEKSIAAELRRAPETVRVTWVEAVEPTVADDSSAESETPFGENVVFRQRETGLFERLDPNIQSSEYRRSVLRMVRPAFALSVRQDDASWLRVQPNRPFLSVWQRNILLSLAVTLLLLVPLAWIFARRLTRPFRALANALGDRADTVPQEGPRELREAAAAIGAMRTRLANEAAERARMLTAIAHDLRTPMTGLRLRIDAAPEPQRTRMVADIDRMQAMIGEVLTFARAAAAPAEVLNVRPLLAEIVREMQGPGASPRLLTGDDARISASASAFRRAIENLLQNAIDYAGGGMVSLERAAGSVNISVQDSGPGIPAADRERLLRPFERGEASRNRDTGGAGLGLSIVRDFAARNRGSFTLTDAPSGGTLVILSLPIA